VNNRERARAYRASHGGFGPARLSRGRKKHERRVIQLLGTSKNPGVLRRLDAVLEFPTVYVFDGGMLGLPARARHASALYSGDWVARWRDAVRGVLEPPYAGFIEFDQPFGTHVHVLAERGACDFEGQPLVSLERFAQYLAWPGDARVFGDAPQPAGFHDDLHNLAAHVANAPDGRVYDDLQRLEAEGLYLASLAQAKREGRQLPRLSFAVGVPRRIPSKS
jgi:hypothetical protein